MAIGALDDYQRRHTWLGMPLATVFKFFEDNGTHLAASLSYYGIASALPMMLLASRVLSTVLIGNPELAHSLAASPIGTVPILGDHLGHPRTLNGGGPQVIVGLLGALYGALGIGNAFQNTMNSVWTVPRNARPNPFALRARSLVIVLLLYVTVAVPTALGILGENFDILGPFAGTACAVLANTVVLVIAMKFGTAARKPVLFVLPGAFVGSVVWLICQRTALAYFSRTLPGASETKALITCALGVIGAIHVAALTFVLSAELNVVLIRRLWPRALLTNITDKVELTEADRTSYAAQAQMQRFKAYQHVSVHWAAAPARPVRRSKRVRG